MAWYTTEGTLYFYETRRGLEPAETEQDAHLTLTLSTQEEYDRETGQVEQTQVQVDYAWSAGRPPTGRSCGGAGHRGLVGAETH